MTELLLLVLRKEWLNITNSISGVKYGRSFH